MIKYGITFLIDYSSQFLIVLIYRNPVLTLIDRLMQPKIGFNQKLAATIN